MRTLFLFVGLLGLAAPRPAAAADGDAPLWLAAGYKALFTCSATFLAAQSNDQIARNELTGIYPDYKAPMGTLPNAQIDRRRGWVSVAYDQTMPPRVAFHRGVLGCVLLPPGGGTALRVVGATPPVLPDPPRNDAPWPEGDRLSQTPANTNTRSKLGLLLRAAFDGETYGEGVRTSGIVIVHRGRIVGEAYARDTTFETPTRTWSVAKSLMGALVGIAVKEGVLRVEEPTGFERWSQPGDPRARITIQNLMHMASGLDAGKAGNRTDEIYFGGGLVEDHALSRELTATPGKRWTYANNDTLLLSYALRQRLGDERRYLMFPYEKLFRRIGMRRTTAETDWNGTFILSSQVWSTARDLARFGLLLANDGVWNGQDVLPRGWVKYMATQAPVQPPTVRADGAQLPNYGAQIWLYGRRHGLPDGTLAAQGNRGQYIVVMPMQNVVMVRRGFDGDGARFALDRFAADVLKALP